MLSAGVVASSGVAAAPPSVPVALLTNSGDYSENAVTATSLTLNKPANVAVGDVLVALVSCQTAFVNGTQNITEGTSTWAIFGPDYIIDGSRRAATTWALVVTSGNIGSLPASWTWTSNVASVRWTGVIFRVTGADVSSGLASAASGESAMSAQAAGNSGNALPAYTVASPTLSLVIACGIAQNTSTQTGAVSWTVTGYTTQTGSYHVDTAPGGVSWSCHYIATKDAESDGSESSVQQVMAPVPANAQTWSIAIKAPGGGAGLGIAALGTSPLGG